MDDKRFVRCMIDAFKSTWQSKILKLAREKSFAKEMIMEMQEAIEENPDKQSGNFKFCCRFRKLLNCRSKVTRSQGY